MRSIVAKALGAIWILDGLLQFQPKMFGMDFVNQVLAPSLTGQPAFLHVIISFGISVWMINPIIATTLAGLIQIGIGVLLWFSDTSKEFKVGLYASIVWGVIVWLFGEGAGLLFVGGQSFYTGAPGAVLFYVLLSILLLISEKINIRQFPKVGGMIFILGALLQLQSGLSNALWVAIPFILGLLLILKPNRTIGVLAFIFLFFVWWLGQGFGGLATIFVGTVTDPNSAPIIALFMLPLFFG